MWPGDQPPGGEQNPQDQGQNPYQQPGYQQPNPYQQPGYQQQNPYNQQAGQQYGQPQWSAPTVPMGSPQPPRDDRRKTMITALVAAGAVVVAAGVTGFLVLGGKKDDKASPAPSNSASASASASGQGQGRPSPSDSGSGGDDDPRGTEGKEKPTVPGWKTVINPRFGTVFDVPSDWVVESPTLSVGFEWDEKGGKTDTTTVTAPAEFKTKWCTDDSDKDGTPEDTSLATAGTRGENGAKNTDDAAETRVPWWIYGGYTHPDKKSLTYSKAKPYTTKSGLKGSLTTAHSTNTPQHGKCATDGKAVTFAFKNSAGDIVSWDLFGVKGAKDELPEATVQKILSTVRLAQDPPTGE